jgi:hypothetical protein
MSGAPGRFGDVFGGGKKTFSRAVNVRPAFPCKEYGLRHERRYPNDREVLVLRHFEELSNAEAAQVLGIEPSAAVNRYVRALKRLKGVFQGMPGGIEGI